MSNAKGVVTRVSTKENPRNKYGVSHKVGIQLDDVDTWYNIAFSKKTPDELGLAKGKLVSFSYTTDDYGHKIDPKSLSVSAAGPSAPASAPAVRGITNANAGIKVGHAINNATQLAIHEGNISIENIGKHAVNIIQLSVRLEGAFDAILAKAAKPKAAPVEPEDDPADEPAEEAPPPKAKAKTPVKKAAAKQPAQEDDDEAFDEDVPF